MRKIKYIALFAIASSLFASCSTAKVQLAPVLKKQANEVTLTDAQKQKIASFFGGNVAFNSTKTYNYVPYTVSIVDEVSSSYRHTKYTEKDTDNTNKTLKENYYKKNGEYTTQETLGIDNKIIEKDVLDGSNHKVPFTSITGSPFSYLTEKNISDYFDFNVKDQTLTLTPSEAGYATINSAFNGFFPFDDTYTYDFKSVTEYLESLTITLANDGTPTSMDFSKVKKDQFGGIREKYHTELSAVEAVPTLPTVEAKNDDAHKKLETALSNLGTKLANGNFTESFSVDLLGESAYEPSTYKSYYQFDKENASIMLSDYALQAQNYGTTYIGVAQTSDSYQWLGVSPSSNYIGAISSDKFTSFTDVLPTIYKVSKDFFTVDNSTYTFDISGLREADHTFQATLLTGLTGSADYFSQKEATYCSDSSYSFTFKTLTIELDDKGEVKDFKLTYLGTDNKDHTATFTFSDFGTTDISKVPELKSAYSTLLSNI